MENIKRLKQLTWDIAQKESKEEIIPIITALYPTVKEITFGTDTWMALDAEEYIVAIGRANEIIEYRRKS